MSEFSLNLGDQSFAARCNDIFAAIPSQPKLKPSPDQIDPDKSNPEESERRSEDESEQPREKSSRFKFCFGVKRFHSLVYTLGRR